MKREQNYIITDLIYSANDYFTINEKLVHSQKKRLSSRLCTHRKKSLDMTKDLP